LRKAVFGIASNGQLCNFETGSGTMRRIVALLVLFSSFYYGCLITSDRILYSSVVQKRFYIGTSPNDSTLKGLWYLQYDYEEGVSIALLFRDATHIGYKKNFILCKKEKSRYFIVNTDNWHENKIYKDSLSFKNYLKDIQIEYDSVVFHRIAYNPERLYIPTSSIPPD
jgi:hypothetical protein